MMIYQSGGSGGIFVIILGSADFFTGEGKYHANSINENKEEELEFGAVEYNQAFPFRQIIKYKTRFNQNPNWTAFLLREHGFLLLFENSDQESRRAILEWIVNEIVIPKKSA